MNKLYSFLFFLAFAAMTSTAFAQPVNNNCDNARFLCPGSTLISTTIGGTGDTGGIPDPVVTCNAADPVQRSIFFRLEGSVTGGTANVVIFNYLGSLEIQAYSGSCGALAPIPAACNSGATPRNISFTVNANEVYYIMVDGDAGNQTNFRIAASGNIKGIPSPTFIASVITGCIVPGDSLQVDVTNTTDSMSVPISYHWSINGGPRIPSTNRDTTFYFSSPGQYLLTLRDSNACGIASVTRTITAQALSSGFTFLPTTGCIGSPIFFTSTANFLPLPPAPPNPQPTIIQWDWDFGDPASGAANTVTTSDDTITHVFVGTGPFTVTLIATEFSCGTNTTSQVVTLLPRPTVDLGADRTVCENDTTTLTTVVSNASGAVTYTWTTTSPGTILCPGPSVLCAATRVADLPVGGPHEFIVYISDTNNCTNSDTLNLTVNPIPQVDLGPDVTVCRWDSVFLFANVLVGNGPFTYLWSPVGGLSCTTCPDPIAVDTVTRNYVVQVTDPAGCSGTDTIRVTRRPKAAVSINPVGPLCASDLPPLQKRFVISGAVGGTATWSQLTLPADLALIDSSGLDSLTIRVTFPPVAGSYCFSAIVTTTFGCKDTVNRCFTLDPGIPVDATPAAPGICQGDSVQLTATGATTYVWTPSTGLSCDSCATPMARPTVTTTYVVVGTQAFCTARDTVIVTVNPFPIVTLSPNTTVCRWTPYQLNPVITTGNPPFTYSWLPTAGLDDPSISNPTSVDTVSRTYCLTLTAAGCPIAVPVCQTVGRRALPTIATNPAGPLCESDAPPLRKRFVISGAGGTGTAQWSVLTSPANYAYIDSSGADSLTIRVTFPPVAGSYCFTALITTNFGCTDTVTRCFTIDPGLPVDATPASASFCQGDSIALSVTGATTYLWSPSAGLSCTACATPMARPTVTTTYVVVGTQGTCTGRDTVIITVNPIPVVTTGANVTACRWVPVPLNATIAPGNAPFTYSWTPTTGLNNPAIPNPVSTAESTQTYCVSVTAAGCPSAAPVCQTVTRRSLPIISTSPAGALCTSDPAPLRRRFVITGAGALTATWSALTAPGSYVLIDSSGVDSLRIRATFPAVAGTYCFTAIIVTGFGCTDTVTSCFTIDPGITVSIAPNPPAIICAGSCTSLTATGPAGSTYSWTSNPAGFTATSATIAPCPTVTTTYYVRATQSSCTARDSVVVSVNPLPTSAASAFPTSICGCTDIALDGSGSSGGMNYSWFASQPVTFSPSNTITSPTALNICQTTTFSIIVTDPSTLCVDTATVTVPLLPRPSATASPIPVFCSGVSNTVNLIGTGSATTPAGCISYLWTSVPPVAIVSPTSLVTSAVITGQTTFTLTVTNTCNGCDSSFSITANTHAPPTLGSVPGGFCTSDPLPWNIALSILGADPGSTFAWTTPGGCVTPTTAPVNSANESFNLSTCGVGNYNFQVIVTDPVTTCVETLSVSIPITSGISVAIIPATVSVCNGTSATLTASGAVSFSWVASPADPTLAGQQTNPSITVTPTITTTYTVTGNTGGCTNVQTRVVTVNNIPATSPITGIAAVCRNSVQQYCVTNTPGSTYVWTVSGAGNTFVAGPGNNCITVTWGAVDATYQITVRETNSSGCQGSVITLNVVVYPLPVSGPITGPSTVCGNMPSVYCTSFIPGVTYSWTVPAGATISPPGNSNCITVNWGTAGGIITVTPIFTATTCQGPTENISVSLFPIPVANAGSNQSVCAGSCVTIGGSPTATAGTGPFSYSWSPPAGLSSTNSPNPVACPASTTTYTVTITDANFCTASSQVVVTASVLPTANAGIDHTVCFGNPVNITGSSGNGTVAWTTTGTGTFTNSANPVTTYNPGGVGVDTLIITVTNACPAARDTAIVTILTSPAANAGAAIGTICEGSLVNISGTASGGTVSWAISPASSGTFAPPNSAATTFTPGAGDTGSFTFTMTVSNLVCPDAISTTSVYFTPQPVSYAGNNFAICSGDSINLSAATVNLPGVALNWTGGDGTFNPSASVLNPVYVPGPLDILNGSVTLCLTSSNPPCNNSVSCAVIAINTTPSVVILASQDTVCAGSSAILTAFGLGSVVWNTSPPQTSPSITVSPTANFTYVATITSIAGCFSSDSKTIFVLDAPQAGNDTLVCFGDTIQLNGITSGNYPGFWTTNGSGTFLPDSNTLSVVYIPGTTDLEGDTIRFVLHTQTNACPDLSDEVLVLYDYDPTINAGPDQSIRLGGSANLDPVVTSAPCVIWTSTGTGTFSPDASTLNAIYVPSQHDYEIGARGDTIVLTLSTCQGVGCVLVSDDVFITISSIVIPNVVTPAPASPGINDFFFIPGLPQRSHLVIFNRWGIKVFETSNYMNNWDGEGLRNGVYFYLLTVPEDFKIKQHKFSGFFELMRE